MTAIDYGHRPALRSGAGRTRIALLAFATALLLLSAGVAAGLTRAAMHGCRGIVAQRWGVTFTRTNAALYGIDPDQLPG